MRKNNRMRSAKKWPKTLTRAKIYLGLAGLLAVTGCGDGKIGRYPVSGIVKVDGQPAGGVQVMFCPVDGPPELQKLRPAAFTKPDGTYQITTIEKGDGAPPGKYKVLLGWAAVVNNQTGDEGQGLGNDRLKGRYWNLEKSQFSIEVKPQANEVPPFELKSK